MSASRTDGMKIITDPYYEHFSVWDAFDFGFDFFHGWNVFERSETFEFVFGSHFG